MGSTEEHIFFSEKTAHIIELFDNIDIGVWEYNLNTRDIKWSSGFYSALGYTSGEIECSYNYFFENLLYYRDRQTFLESTRAIRGGSSPITQIRLLTKLNGYQWFESKIHYIKNLRSPLLYGTFVNINKLKLAELTAAEKDFKSEEIGRIAKIGIWEIDVKSMELILSKEIYEVFELDTPVQMSVDEAISFFEPKYQQQLRDALQNAIDLGKPYDLDAQFRTAKNNVVWVKAKGVPVINDHGSCIAIRGIFQDIDSVKKSGITLQSSVNLLDDQNKRLQNFAYIVSHNLRSHAGNLKSMVTLFEDTQLEQDRLEIFSHISTISQSLSATMEHLDEIVKMQAEISKGTSLVNFERTFGNVVSALETNISATNAKINTNFADAPEVNYIPAYLESIFFNLLTNALKYKHPNRNAVLNITTQSSGKEIYLIFEDNGLGIDLNRHGSELFGMYKTFHRNNDSKGIGLFMTRNQVEALGGSIVVDSTVNVGTKFTIKLV
ncbi:PAS domain-containing protein [Mucilaginibacter litoreus]|uniref:histidine kinase n=1 Tax=Mucilaginibacter litoreus TaxID=1048221 RepID=A0ABW3ATZ0_9SPHI